MNTLLLPFLLYFAQQPLPPVLVTDQAAHRIIMADANTGTVYWEWKAGDVAEDHKKWFSNPSDVKMVMDNRYVLTCASGGGVALVRLQDGKTVFYDYAGGNTHSAELLPDGNIVTASSTGNYLCVFRADTSGGYQQGRLKQKVFLADAHNAVWYYGRLWAGGRSKLYAFRYNNSRETPALHKEDSVKIPGKNAHDMIVAPASQTLWLSMEDTLLEFNPGSKKFAPVKSRLQHNVKSISPGHGAPALVTVPKEQWWTDEIHDTEGRSILKKEGWKIYKARWATSVSTSSHTLDNKDGSKKNALKKYTAH
ncbi:DUF6528 family protein [Chitinophaga sp. GCM10012297]|uniref:Uncharacterized protein n=1 Tax=Chitinophaga chungangae TaxID=2821488 RepID=A0ABS3YED0_9BACT|nr:DUF6528 family protein [Chitinophaga chungangae]MBO9153031.1 hypothetical protein [Chitinophaga chungangae]